MRLRKAEHPALAFLIWCAFAAVAAAAGYVEGAKVRKCPAQLEDGRQLNHIHLDTNTCGYTPSWARPFDGHSPEELRRLANARAKQLKGERQ